VCECIGVKFAERSHECLRHTIAVLIEGEFRDWGCGTESQLGLGDTANRLAPTLAGAQAACGGLPVLKMAYCESHTMAVMRDGALCTFGRGLFGELSHNDHISRLVPMRTEAQHFGNANRDDCLCCWQG